MFKGNKKYLYIFFGIFVVIIAVQYLLPKPINWNRTYQNKDKSPFGCYAIYHLIDGAYGNEINSSKQTLYNLKTKIDSGSTLIMINDRFDLNKSDIRSLFDILEKGNSVLLAANEFGGTLTDTFHLKTEYEAFSYYSNIDSLIYKPGENIKLKANNYSNKKYNYSKAAWVSVFESFDTTRFSILATTDKQKSCLIRTNVGKGKLYLMSMPDAFGNYFIVNHKNREFPYVILSELKNKHIIWDEYYKTFNVNNYSFMKFILESDPLYTAYLLLFFTIILYMMSEGRRRQRAIPITEPINNSTLEFVNVISHVYYNSKNHQSIAIEKIKYFYENIRKKFNLNTSEINEELINHIADLSGVEHKLVKQLFTYCEKIKITEDITEYDLIELNRQINNFNKNSLR